MNQQKPLSLTMNEARALMVIAQKLDVAPTSPVSSQDIQALIEHLGAVQIDAITVVKPSQYLVLWSRLGTYAPELLDELLFPGRQIFEYWSHAASIVPMQAYRYYRPYMLQTPQHHQWGSIRPWMEQNEATIQNVLAFLQEHGPLASSEFALDKQKTQKSEAVASEHASWNWYGDKETRRALQVLWTRGDIMIYQRRRGKKVYDVHERILREAFAHTVPSDDELPGTEEIFRYFVCQTIAALGVVTPSWLEGYFSLAALQPLLKARRACIAATLRELALAKEVIEVTGVDLHEPTYIASSLLPELESIRTGRQMTRTALLSPFDNLIWDRNRTRQVFAYDVSFEAYKKREQRQYGYYCLAILHHGQLVGRLDPKFFTKEKRLEVQSLHFEPSIVLDEALITGVNLVIKELATFLGATSIQLSNTDDHVLQ
jgi:uncharacterized protein